MKVYLIWNETKQEPVTYTSNYVGFYLSLKSAKNVLAQLIDAQELLRNSVRIYYPDYLIIKEFELYNEKEIVK